MCKGVDRLSQAEADQICEEVIMRTIDKDCGEFCDRLDKLRRMHSGGSMSVLSGSRSRGMTSKS
jgi:hypothetical protein